MARICSPVTGVAVGRPTVPKWRNVIFAWLARSMSPTLRMSPAVSSKAFASGLTFFFFFAMIHLLDNSIRQGLRNRFGIRVKPRPGDLPRGCEFVFIDTRARALGEPEQEHRACQRPVGDQHPETAR